MSNTFTQIHIHTVFAVQNRESLLKEAWRERLYNYIIAVMQKHGHKVLSIGGMADHVHILFGFRPAQSLSALMLEVKRDSSAWINQNKFAVGRFAWQEGYGAFSYGKSQIPSVVDYIKNQKAHHAKRTFTEEFKKFLDAFGVKYDKQYLFHEVEQVASLQDAGGE